MCKVNWFKLTLYSFPISYFNTRQSFKRLNNISLFRFTLITNEKKFFTLIPYSGAPSAITQQTHLPDATSLMEHQVYNIIYPYIHLMLMILLSLLSQIIVPWSNKLPFWSFRIYVFLNIYLLFLFFIIKNKII